MKKKKKDTGYENDTLTRGHKFLLENIKKKISVYNQIQSIKIDTEK